MNTIYIIHENTTRTTGRPELFRVVTAAHPFFRMPEIQGPGLFINRYKAEIDLGRKTKIIIGSLTDYPVRHDPVLSDAIRKYAVAHVQREQK